MKKIDLRLLSSAKDFEELCSELLKCEYSDGRSYDDATGDHGIDFSRGNERILYQFYYPEPCKVTEMTSKIKRKIQQSLKRVATLNPMEWYLVIPYKAQRAVYTYLQMKQEEYPEVHIDIIDETAIQILLAKHPPLHEVWIQRVYGGEDANLSAEAFAYKYRDRPDKLLRMGGDIAQALGHWKFGDLYHLVQTNDGKTGLSLLNIRPNTPEIAKSHPITIEWGMILDEHDPKLEEYKRFIEGDSDAKTLRINKEHIVNLSTKIGEVPWKMLDEIDFIEIIPLSMPPKKIDIKLYDGDHRQIDAFVDYRFTSKLKGAGLEMTCTRADNSVVRIVLEYDGVSRQLSMNLMKDLKLDSAHQAHEFMSKVVNLQKASLVELEIEGDENVHEFEKPKQRLRKHDKQMLDITNKLKLISEMMRTELPSILDMEHSQSDIDAVHAVYEILRKGKLVSKYREFTLTLSNPSDKVLSTWASGRHFRLKQTNCVEFTMLGVPLDMGEVSRYFHIEIDDETEKAIREYSDRGEGGLVLKMKAPEGHNEVVDFFHRWHKKPAEIEAFEK